MLLKPIPFINSFLYSHSYIVYSFYFLPFLLVSLLFLSFLFSLDSFNLFSFYLWFLFPFLFRIIFIFDWKLFPLMDKFYLFFWIYFRQKFVRNPCGKFLFSEILFLEPRWNLLFCFKNIFLSFFLTKLDGFFILYLTIE